MPAKTKHVLEIISDVFNLEATMYWVLTDRSYPTDIRQPIRKGGIELVRADEALTLKEINPKLPIVLSQLVMECCRQNPAERPADMKQLQSRLEVVQRMWRKQKTALKVKARSARQARDSAARRARTPNRQES